MSGATTLRGISEHLLNAYAQSLLLDKYDIYQIIIDYWSKVMQDYVYVITQDGWQEGKAQFLKVLIYLAAQHS